MTRVPIACTLTEEDAADRVDEWRDFLATAVQSVDGHDTFARLLLRAGDDVLLRAVDLAEREKSCCGFFGFSVVLEDQGRWLTITVPLDAAPVLHGLLALATR